MTGQSHCPGADATRPGAKEAEQAAGTAAPNATEAGRPHGCSSVVPSIDGRNTTCLWGLSPRSPRPQPRWLACPPPPWVA